MKKLLARGVAYSLEIRQKVHYRRALEGTDSNGLLRRQNGELGTQTRFVLSLNALYLSVLWRDRNACVPKQSVSLFICEQDALHRPHPTDIALPREECRTIWT